MSVFRKIACAISGGVDSSVSAYLLKKKGYEVVGVYMRNWDIRDDDQCTGDKDIEDAAYVCKKLGIEFHVVNFVKEYWISVFSKFLDDYESGSTPNPDILCNKNIKFKSFFKYAIENLNVDAIATGHYANSSFGQFLELYHPFKRTHLLRAIDFCKDQTFFLSQISQESLKRTMFPIGCLMKSEVKKIAYETEFRHLAMKKESMGICFIGANNYKKFINDYIEPNPGNLIDVETGKIIGAHNGIHLWTIGQKCDLPGLMYAYYVVKKSTKTNNIYVVPGTHHPLLYHNQIITDKPHWIHSKPYKKGERFSCYFCFQHRNPLTPCTVSELSDGSLHVVIDTPLRALTPGQFAVFYRDDVCFGSSKIIDLGPSLYNLEHFKNLD